MTTATLAAIVLIGGFIALMLMRVPVSFAMLLSTLGCALVTGTNFSVLVRQDGGRREQLFAALHPVLYPDGRNHGRGRHFRQDH